MRCLSPVLLAFALAAQELPKAAPRQEATVQLGGVAIKYLYFAAAAGRPLIVFLPDGMEDASTKKAFDQWQPIAASAGWSLVVPQAAGISDPVVKALEAVLMDAKKRIPGVDETRVYLIGQSASTPEVFYTVSRTPDLWAAALAIQGSPGAAIQSFRLFGANTHEVPTLWIARAAEVDLYSRKLEAAGFRYETRPEANVQQVFEWLAKHQRALFPLEVDCETGSPAFGRCYWIEMTKFDPKLRNDVLKSTRVMPGSGASLAIGPFGFDPLAEGPGALVGWLPPNYNGPLKLNDRIIAVAGKEISDGREYSRVMEEFKEEKAIAVVMQRGKERQRIETRILLPKREETTTARIQGHYTPDQKELLLISRAVSEARVQIPPEWPPLALSWNGQDFPKLESPGCWQLSIAKTPEATKCK